MTLKTTFFSKVKDIFKGIDHDLNISGIFSYGANEDYENADGDAMIEKYPEHAALIRALTGELKYL